MYHLLVFPCHYYINSCAEQVTMYSMKVNTFQSAGEKLCMNQTYMFVRLSQIIFRCQEKSHVQMYFKPKGMYNLHHVEVHTLTDYSGHIGP